MEKKLIRTVGTLMIREQEGNEESRVISGLAIPFNSPSQDLGGFIEYVMPDALKAEWVATQDVKLNMLHDRRDTIARTPNLKLTVEEDGLHFEVELPECDICDRALAMIRTGVYTGCSFEAITKTYGVEEMEDGKIVVRHYEFEELQAITIGMDPAYLATTVTCREISDEEKQKNEELLRKTQQEKLEREQELRRRRYYLAFGY